MLGINIINDNLRLTPSLSTDMQFPPASNSSVSAQGDNIFGNILKDAVGQVNHLEDQAHMAIEGLMKGTGIDVHQALIAAENASMAFDFAMAIRNKAIQTYQTIMGMQF